MSRYKRWLLILAGIGVAYAGTNLLLVGTHVVKHRDDRARLDTLERQLQAERREIEALEGQLTKLEGSLERAEADLGRLGRWIESVESRYPRGIPTSRYAEYSSNVDRYNSMIQEYNETLADYQQLQPEYAARIDSFNAHATDANALAQKIGNVPHLLPVDLSATQRPKFSVTSNQ